MHHWQEANIQNGIVSWYLALLRKSGQNQPQRIPIQCMSIQPEHPMSSIVVKSNTGELLSANGSLDLT
jgi:hypothetical protein